MAEVSSSQELLPLSQETFNAIWETVPAVIQDIGKGNDFLSNLCHELVFEETADPKPMGIDMESQIVPPPPQFSLPTIEDFPGTLNFTVSLTVSEKVKSSPYMYSDATNKLYVRKDVPCPFNFKVNKRIENCCIRAILFFTSQENTADAVVRCINHSFEDRDNGDPFFEHLVHCESQCSNYFKDHVSKRLSVTVPFENPSVGEEYSTYLYKFTCFTSCPGGPNRRPFSVVFTLENGNVVLGRRKIDLKVCSSPFRDKQGDEKILMKKMNLNKLIQENEPDTNVPKNKRKLEDKPEEDVYIIKVKDKECYDLLQCVKKVFYAKKISNGGPNWVPTRATEFSNLLRMLTSSSDEEKENCA